MNSLKPRLRFFASAAIVAFVWTVAAAAEGATPFVTAKYLDLTHLLPPPPANDSPQTRAEIGELLAIQVTRSPAMEEHAIADMVEDIWRFSDVFPLPMRAAFNKENLPVFAAFFARVVASEGATVDPAKEFWNRPRPFQLSALVKPCVKMSQSGSWPSGHGTAGYLMATVLAEMVPERRGEIFARAADYAESRIVGGVHYRSDTVVSRAAGALIAYRMMQIEDYKSGFAQAKTELRIRLGL